VYIPSFRYFFIPANWLCFFLVLWLPHCTSWGWALRPKVFALASHVRHKVRYSWRSAFLGFHFFFGHFANPQRPLPFFMPAGDVSSYFHAIHLEAMQSVKCIRSLSIFLLPPAPVFWYGKYTLAWGHHLFLASSSVITFSFWGCLPQIIFFLKTHLHRQSFEHK